MWVSLPGKVTNPVLHLHEQCHQLRGWGVVYLLYLLACALQYRYLNNIMIKPQTLTLI
jgi:hypothetical protein